MASSSGGGLRAFAAALAGRAVVGGAVGAVLAVGLLAADRALALGSPITLENAQPVLATLVGAVFTIAVFALWMRTVVVGITSGQVSPRVASSYLDDDFQQRIVGWMVGGLAYLVTLALLMPGPGDAAGPPVISAVVAVLIAVAALVGVLVATRQAVATLSPPVVVRELADQVFERLHQPRWPDDPVPHEPVDEASLTPVASRGIGWVQAIDHRSVLARLPEDGVAVLYVGVGDFVAPGDRLAALVSDDGDDISAVRDSITLARARDTDADLGFAIQQLVDVIAHSTAAGSRDTSTAVEGLVHLRAVLRELILRGTATGCLEGDGGRRVVSRAVLGSTDHLRDVTTRLRGSVGSDPIVAASVRRNLEWLAGVAADAGDEASQRLLDQERRRLEDAMERNGLGSEG